MRELIVPTTDVNSDTAIVTVWHVPDRSYVSAGDLVAEIETSKAVLDVVAPEPGYLLRCAQEGDEIVLLSALAYLFETSEALDGHAARLAEATAAASESSNGVRATAPAIQRAAELGVDLGSLPGGALVTLKMVEAAAGDAWPAYAMGRPWNSLVAGLALDSPRTPRTMRTGSGKSAIQYRAKTPRERARTRLT